MNKLFSQRNNSRKQSKELTSMNVLVVGANGQVGKLLVNMLRDSQEHTVKAMVRKEEQAEAFRKMEVEVAVPV